MDEAKKNKRAKALKEVKRLCKEFGFTACMLKASFSECSKATDKVLSLSSKSHLKDC